MALYTVAISQCMALLQMFMSIMSMNVFSITISTRVYIQTYNIAHERN